MFEFITAGIMSVVSAILRGLVISKLWLWFIVPVFHLPILTIVYAIGISYLVSLLTHQPIYTDDKRESSERVIMQLSEAISLSLIVLLFGWILTFFI